MADPPSFCSESSRISNQLRHHTAFWLIVVSTVGLDGLEHPVWPKIPPRMQIKANREVLALNMCIRTIVLPLSMPNVNGEAAVFRSLCRIVRRIGLRDLVAVAQLHLGDSDQ